MSLHEAHLVQAPENTPGWGRVHVADASVAFIIAIPARARLSESDEQQDSYELACYISRYTRADSPIETASLADIARGQHDRVADARLVIERAEQEDLVTLCLQSALRSSDLSEATRRFSVMSRSGQ